MYETPGTDIVEVTVTKEAVLDKKNKCQFIRRSAVSLDDDVSPSSPPPPPSPSPFQPFEPSFDDKENVAVGQKPADESEPKDRTNI